MNTYLQDFDHVLQMIEWLETVARKLEWIGLVVPFNRKTFFMDKDFATSDSKYCNLLSVDLPNRTTLTAFRTI